MKKLIIPILFFTYTLLSSSSCKKTSALSEFNKNFPNTIGNWWKYKVYDSTNNFIDTVKITVTGTTKMNTGQEVKVWQINSLVNKIDTNYVYSTKNIVLIYPTRTTAIPLKKYVFPLSVTAYWTNENIRDTTKTVYKGDKSVLGTNFPDAFKIIRNLNIPNYSFHIEEWFKEELGMISFYINEYDGTPPRKIQKWELLDYHIN